ncbi:flagellar M-ring protein FliF [Breoghania corrubedonensis]|uniref:Flagellar M-ring protein n=1 Tax=Breoghania corrubedonensis TaxID=665038 RepID=A0A2T5V8S0_9HYPH|nr:flagellar basal-body MS-ring/collar protein FliF [Breoghania corrubedonensis]PTW60156.1 flagellar M-ring protein FliF [Breoghania corrubedonensis]
MPGREHAEKLWSNLLELGPKRLIALALIGLATMMTVGFGAYYLSRPEMVMLYTGLEGEDVSRIGAALQDAGIPYDINAEGTAVLVNHSATARARMLLAERGLPRGAEAGYELFDQIGSLGLTSFMQEVTRVRALEGEIARTIQLMSGVRAARVHIVMPEKGSFRRDQQPPSASVVIRMDSADEVKTAEAIRHLVAAAVPGMTADKVTVLDTHGTMLATGKDPANASAGMMASLEEAVNARIQENIRTTLTPYLGLDNFEVSVTASLNTDRKHTNEVIYDPDSRTERSVRTVREEETSQNASSEPPTTVEQNLPNENVTANAGDRSNEENNRREETVNYEISSKTIETARDGYRVDRLSIAVLVDKARMMKTLGEDAGEEAVDAQLADIKQIVASAAGIDAKRGDSVTVSMVDFIANGRDLEPVPPISLVELFVRQSGNVINALTILIVAGMLVWFGLRPALAALVPAKAPPAQISEFEALPGSAEAQAALEGGEGEAALRLAPPDHSLLIQDLTRKINQSPLKKLEPLLDLDEDQAAAILKQWMYETEVVR